MKLFKTDKLKKFYSILDKMNRVCEIRYNNDCEKTVFVRRTVNKFFKGKFLILYNESTNFGTQYKQYISVSNIKFTLGYSSNNLEMYYFDYSKPQELFNFMDLPYNEVKDLEGEWCKNNKKHSALLKHFMLDIPVKKYIFKAYDFNKINTLSKKEVKKINESSDYSLLETSVTFLARTEKEAFHLKNKYQKEIKGRISVTDNFIIK